MASQGAKYLKRPGEQPSFRIGEVRNLVAEHDYLYSLYDADVTDGSDSHWRHLLVIPAAMSAASFSVGLALDDADSRKIDAGDLDWVATLAGNVQYAYRRYRVFPANELGRFVL